MHELAGHVRAVGLHRVFVYGFGVERRQLPVPVHRPHTTACSGVSAGRSARPQRTIRSPSVERLICSSAAARDLLPCVARSAQRIRLDSNSRTRSSSEIGDGFMPAEIGAKLGIGTGGSSGASANSASAGTGGGMYGCAIGVTWAGAANAARGGCPAAPKRIDADTQPMRTAPH